MTVPPSVTSLTEKQSARRERVIAAAFALAEEGGYEAVQMRDVAARADVALGTVYRYFSSKDQLLAAAWTHWRSQLERRLHGQPLQGDTRADRVLDFLMRATRPLERRPRLAEALLKSFTSPHTQAAGHQREVASWMTRIVLDALDGLPDADQQDIREVLGHVWYSVLLAWVNERIDAERMHALLETSCRLLVDGRG